MKKSIKILSILSVVMAGVSFLLSCLFLTAFWELLCIVMSATKETIEIGPILPIGESLYIIGCLIFVVLLFVTDKSTNNITIELVSILFLGVIFPLLSWWLGVVQVDNVAFYGVRYYSAWLTTKNILLISGSIMNLSADICLVICGMRISKKQCVKEN